MNTGKLENVLLGLVDEESRSKSGRHVCRRIPLILTKEHRLVPVNRVGDRIADQREAKTTYSKGRAVEYKVRLLHGEFAIQVSLVKNLWGQVKGWITVYNCRGEIVYRARYVEGELRRSIGNPIYAWIVRLVSGKLKIPVKRTRLGDEGGR